MFSTQVALGARDKAAAHLQACLQQDPDNAKLAARFKKLKRGTRDAERVKADVEAALKAGDAKGAARACTEGIAIDPDDKKLVSAMHVRRAKCYQLLARTAARAGDDCGAACWRKCHADANAALYHDDAKTSAYLLAAEALQGLGRWQDAVNVLGACVEGAGKEDRSVHEAYKKAERLLKKANRPNLYKAVGEALDEHSTEDELKKAYKKACLKWHPDRFSAKGEAEQKKAEENFKTINDAYEFITDAPRKKLYDAGYDREEIEQKLEMQKQQAAHGGGFPGGMGGFPGGGMPGGFHFRRG